MTRPCLVTCQLPGGNQDPSDSDIYNIWIIGFFMRTFLAKQGIKKTYVFPSVVYELAGTAALPGSAEVGFSLHGLKSS